MAEAEPRKRGTKSAVPEELSASADAFLTLSDVCNYMTSTSVIQGAGEPEYETMSLATQKPELKNALTEALHEVTGVLLAGVGQFADAAADLEMRAKRFRQAGG